MYKSESTVELCTLLTIYHVNVITLYEWDFTLGSVELQKHSISDIINFPEMK